MILKKILLTTGTIGIISIPTAIVTSCGTASKNNKNIKKDNTNSGNGSTKGEENKTKIADDFEPKDLSLYNQTKYINFINHLWSDTNNNFTNLTIDKLVDAIKSKIKKITIAKDYNNRKYGGSEIVAKIITTKENKKYFFLNVGDKYSQLSLLVKQLKKLNSKPSYQEFIKLFTHKSTSGISHRKSLDTVLKYAFNDDGKYKVELAPTKLEYLLDKTNDNTLDNVIFAKTTSQQKFDKIFTKLKETVKNDFAKLTNKIFIDTLKSEINTGTNSHFWKITFSPDLIDENVEGTTIENETSKDGTQYKKYIVKKYGKYGITSRRINNMYINSLGDKYNDITNWVENIKTKAIDWNSKNSVTLKEFINLFKVKKEFGKETAVKTTKENLIRVFKIALGDISAPTLLDEVIIDKLPNSNAIDEDVQGNIINNKLTNQKPGLSYSPIETNHNSLLIKKDDPKISFWNILRYGTVDFKDNKTNALAKTIVDMNSSIVGLGEIKGQRAVESLTKKLNQIDSKSGWKFIRSGVAAYLKDGTTTSSSKLAAEYYGFVYKGTEFTIKPFLIPGLKTTTPYGKIYENPKLDNEFKNGEKTGFVRPPFGVQFINKSGKDFTTVITHNDSPGYGSRSQKGTTTETKVSKEFGSFPSQGTQELWEALHTVDVMKYFDSIDGDNADLIFMGDTNIKYDQNLSSGKIRPNIFDSIQKENYKPLTMPRNTLHKTSLGYTDYANAYDRIFVKSNMLKNYNFQKYDLIDKWKDLNLFKTIFGQEVINEYNKKSQYIVNNEIKPKLIRIKISDHAPVSSIWDLTKTELDGSSHSIDWNNYLKTRKNNLLKIPGSTKTTTTKTNLDKLNELFKKINNKDIDVTLNDYDISKTAVQKEIIEKITLSLKLTSTEESYLKFKLPKSGLINEKTNLNITISIKIDENNTKDANLNIKKYIKTTTNKQWKNTISFKTFISDAKLFQSKSNTQLRYDTLYKYLEEKNVTKKGKKIFGLSKTTSAKWIIKVLSTFTYDDNKTGNQNWKLFFEEVKKESPKTSSWEPTKTYTKVMNSFALLLNDVDDTTTKNHYG